MRVEPADDGEFNLYTSPDCAGTPFEKGYRTWFCFSVKGVAKGRTLAFNMYNMNSQGKVHTILKKKHIACIARERARPHRSAARLT